MAKRFLKALPLKSVLQFKSTRDYVGHYYEFRKALDSSFGYQVFAKECGLKSASYLQMVIAGKRILSPSCVHKISEAAKLSFKEHEYLETLALSDTAKTSYEASYYNKKLKILRKNPESKSLQVRKLSAKSFESIDWKFMPLIALLTASPAPQRFDDLCKRLRCSKTELHAQINYLKELNLVTEFNGELCIDLDSVSLHDSKDFAGLQRKILAQLLQFSLNAFEKNYNQSKFYSHTLTADPKRISELHDEIRSLLATLTEVGSSHENRGLVQVNLQCFDLMGAAN